MQTIKTIQTDVAIIGAGGAGLRAAIAIAEHSSTTNISLISKVYPMRSHTVAAEGGAAGVVQQHDALELHFNDTVSGGDWLCDQDAVEYFVANCTKEMIQMEHWGCPWSRQENGKIAVRAFGGMKIERTWYAADKTGFHMLHTLFQTSTKYSNIKRFDEHFCLDLIVHDNRVQGVLVQSLAEGEPRFIQAKSVIIATGGAGRVFRYNTNGGIVTGDGMSLAYRNGVRLRDMEFVQYHPTGLPGTGVLMTEGCRGEGGILVNKDGYRYLQDYDLGPAPPVGETKNKFMELGPRDKLSQSFYQEQQKGKTIKHPIYGDVVHLDLRHLGEAKINERLPFIRELSKAYMNIDPVSEPVPVRPTVHYTMGGIYTDKNCATNLDGLFAVGECASVGIHGANRLGSNSLAELLVFGKVAGESAARYAEHADFYDPKLLSQIATDKWDQARKLINPKGSESQSSIRNALGMTMEKGMGIYRTEQDMQETLSTILILKERYKNIKLVDQSHVFNTEWIGAIELGFLIDIAEAMTIAALNRKESRGSHQRLDEFQHRDDENFLKHSLIAYREGKTPVLSYSDVVITKSAPGKRVYGEKMQEQGTVK